MQLQMNVTSAIVVFGSARIPSPEDSERVCANAREAMAGTPDDPDIQAALTRALKLSELVPYYQEAKLFASMAAKYEQADEPHDFIVTTGGGPGITEAANRGASEAGQATMAFNIEIEHETGAEPVYNARALLQLSLLRYAQDAFLAAGAGAGAGDGGLFGWLRDARRVV